ncbi:uncharacterized protein [Eleutherodactylus coqui]|uniref:uncharacterized protein isoform X2 n=1 Tax=Eleutherodactylus coqui TaxID=57060 RepID=UPI003462382C
MRRFHVLLILLLGICTLGPAKCYGVGNEAVKHDDDDGDDEDDEDDDGGNNTNDDAETRSAGPNVTEEKKENMGGANRGPKKNNRGERRPCKDRSSTRAAIFALLSIVLFLLVLLTVVLLRRYAVWSRCWRRLKEEDESTVKMKPQSNVTTIYATAGQPRDSENSVQLPQSGHFYQEIADVRVGAPGPDSSYSTVGLPYQDQTAADHQPTEG